MVAGVSWQNGNRPMITNQWDGISKIFQNHLISVNSHWTTTRVGWWYTYPLKNMSSSVAIMTFPIYAKIIIHVPNHQPGLVCTTIFEHHFHQWLSLDALPVVRRRRTWRQVTLTRQRKILTGLTGKEEPCPICDLVALVDFWSIESRRKLFKCLGTWQIQKRLW